MKSWGCARCETAAELVSLSLSLSLSKNSSKSHLTLERKLTLHNLSDWLSHCCNHLLPPQFARLVLHKPSWLNKSLKAQKHLERIFSQLHPFKSCCLTCSIHFWSSKYEDSWENGEALQSLLQRTNAAECAHLLLQNQSAEGLVQGALSMPLAKLAFLHPWASAKAQSAHDLLACEEPVLIAQT